MADIKVRVDNSNVKARVGQQNAVKIVASLSGSAGGKAIIAENVVGGIASITALNVSGISTFIGISTFKNDVYIDGDLYLQDDLRIDELNARNVSVTGLTSTKNLLVGFATVTDAFYYTPSYTNGVAYFNSSGLMVSTGSTGNAINYTNYLLTTNNSGVPTWSENIDGGSY